MLELLKKMFVALDDDSVVDLAPRCLVAGYTREEIFRAMNIALLEIGNMYVEGTYKLSDLMMAGIIFDRVMKLPELDITNDIERSVSIGTIVLGTIESDIHDLGKSIFQSAATAAGFQIIDIGVDVSPLIFCDYVRRYKPDILAISAILTTTVPYIQSLIKQLERTDLRSNVKIIIGSSMATQELCDMIGADAFTNNIFEGIDICKEWILHNEK